MAGRLGFVGLLYNAGNLGLFEGRSGGLLPMVSLGASYAPPIGARHRFEVILQYDFHRVITPALRDAGFNRPGRCIASH